MDFTIDFSHTQQTPINDFREKTDETIKRFWLNITKHQKKYNDRV